MTSGRAEDPSRSRRVFLHPSLWSRLRTVLRRNRRKGPAIPNRFALRKELNGRKIALQVLAEDYSIETMPSWVSLGSSCRCNLRCPHCYTHGTEERHRFYMENSWPTDTLQRVAKEILPTAFSVSLTVNGEPLMTQDFAELIDDFEYYGASVDIPTNGTLLSDRNIAALLKSAAHIAVSIDGATERTFEAIRKGARFRNVLNNVRVLTMASELAGKAKSINIVIACTLMGSNIRELPDIIRLAKVLGIRHVSFFPLEVFFDHVRNEALGMHKAAYNHFRQQAEDEARRLGITLEGLQPPFPDAVASPEAFTPLPDMILSTIDEQGSFGELPPLESFLDGEKIKERVGQVLQLVKKKPGDAKDGIGSRKDEYDDAAIESDRAQLKRFEALLEKKDFRNHGEYHYCQYIHNRTYVALDGSVYPCCIASPPVPALGNVTRNTMREIWNGDQYHGFRRAFYSSDPPDCCAKCRYRLKLAPRELYGLLMSNRL